MLQVVALMINWVTIILVLGLIFLLITGSLHLKVYLIIYLSNDVNYFRDVYIKDLVTGEIKLVSLDENNNQPNDDVRLSGITADGHQYHLQLMLLT